MNPSVLHLVISLAPGGLERLVVDWTNARNRRLSGSTRIVCLDELGAMVGQVDDGWVSCVNAHRSRFPWDHAAVRRIVILFRTPHYGLHSLGEGGSGLPASPVLHAHNLSAWQYGVLFKLFFKPLTRQNAKSIEQKLAKSAKEEGDSPRRGRRVEREKEEENVSRFFQMAGTPLGKIAKHLSGGRGDEATTLGRECGSDSPPRRVAGISSRSAGLNTRNIEFSSLSQPSSDSVVKSSSSLRLIYTQHGANVHNMRLRDRLRARLLACFTDEIVAVSEATADVMAKTMWVSRKRIRVVVNGVGESHGSGVASRKSEVREKSGIPADAFVMGSVGRLAHVKGQDRLIAAFAALKPQLLSCQVAPLLSESHFGHPPTTQQPNNPTTFLLLTGDGPERANLERQAMDLGIADRVIFAGYQADPAPYLAAMDLFVLPSRSEGVSVALLEAMAAGVPVAVTDVGANREVVEEGKCGVILTDDEMHWPEAITALITDREATTQRTQAAQQRIRTHYSLDATLDGYERLYGGGAHMTSVGDENCS